MFLWTVFSGERCGPWTFLCFAFPGYNRYNVINCHLNNENPQCFDNLSRCFRHPFHLTKKTPIILTSKKCNFSFQALLLRFATSVNMWDNMASLHWWFHQQWSDLYEYILMIEMSDSCILTKHSTDHAWVLVLTKNTPFYSQKGKCFFSMIRFNHTFGQICLLIDVVPGPLVF